MIFGHYLEPYMLSFRDLSKKGSSVVHIVTIIHPREVWEVGRREGGEFLLSICDV